jgi:hypothetical protein
LIDHALRNLWSTCPKSSSIRLKTLFKPNPIY